MTDRVTIERETLERTINALDDYARNNGWPSSAIADPLRAALAAQPAEPVEPDRIVQIVRPLPETMSRDEMLRHYSEHANLCAHEAIAYQKRIRDLEKALAAPPAQPADSITPSNKE